MLVTHKKTFNLGGLLGLTFFGVLLLIFSPVFGGKNGLQYSDDLFNKLAKGSSYFIPKITKNVQTFEGKSFAIAVKLDKPETAQEGVKILTTAGVQASATNTELKISGDLGKMLFSALSDSDAMYQNEGSKVSSRYGFDEREAMTVWWSILNKMNKEFQKEKKIEESGVVSEVMKKGIEPAFNFYGIEAQNVIKRAGTMTGLLVFYVMYTMWWGYATFYLFDGLGLSMKKAKVKKEV